MSVTLDWPADVEKPPLPDGYEWVCLRPALGIGDPGKHPWWVRVSWSMRNGKRRFVSGMMGYYETPQHAIDSAIHIAKAHAEKRQKLYEGEEQ
jgi:hypothetical protein